MTKHPLFVFDLDGVITDPHDSSVDDGAVTHIHRLLETGLFVAVNTGRSFEWVEKHLLGRLKAKGASKVFDHLLIVCEKGGECVAWQHDTFVPRPSRFSLPEAIRMQCRQLFTDNAAQFPTMFWDETKQTMATIEKYPAADLDDFRYEQQALTAMLERAFAGQNVRIDATTIAIDVESHEAGKHAGAELIYEWFAVHADIAQATFTSFGDSVSDYEMARYFAQQGNDSIFVFVGKAETLFAEHEGVRLVRTKQQYSAGTREYFTQIL